MYWASVLRMKSFSQPAIDFVYWCSCLNKWIEIYKQISFFYLKQCCITISHLPLRFFFFETIDRINTNRFIPHSMPSFKRQYGASKMYAAFYIMYGSHSEVKVDSGLYTIIPDADAEKKKKSAYQI